MRKSANFIGNVFNQDLKILWSGISLQNTISFPTMRMVACAGCDAPILDRFLLKVEDRAWHAKCVKCWDCQSILADKCFSRDGKLYCRTDFFRWVFFSFLVEFFIALFFKCSAIQEWYELHYCKNISDNKVWNFLFGKAFPKKESNESWLPAKPWYEIDWFFCNNLGPPPHIKR